MEKGGPNSPLKSTAITEGSADDLTDCYDTLPATAKLYIMFSPSVQDEALRVGNLRDYLSKNLTSLSYSETGDITKFALHGFWGTPEQLLRLYAEKSDKYLVHHMTKIRESILEGKNARVMETQERTLRTDWDQERG